MSLTPERRLADARLRLCDHISASLFEDLRFVLAALDEAQQKLEAAEKLAVLNEWKHVEARQERDLARRQADTLAEDVAALVDEFSEWYDGPDLDALRQALAGYKREERG